MSGFQHAGVTKGMMVSLGISSLAISLMDIKPYFHLQLVPHISTYHQFWRVLVHPFVFANSTELLMGMLLFYNVGVGIERSFGSRKYASFILISSIVSTVISSILILLFHPFGLNSIPAGPYGILFSLLWQHYRTVPSLYQFRLASIGFSSKIFIWIYASQLVLSQPPSSILASTSGLLTGYLYRTDLLLLPTFRSRRFRLRPLKSYTLPLSIHLLLSRLLEPIFGGSQPPRRRDRVLPGQLSDHQIATQARVSAIATGLGGEGMGREVLRRVMGGELPPPRPVPQRVPITPSTVAATSIPNTAVTTASTANTESTTTPLDTGSTAGVGGGPGVVGSGAPGGARARMGEWVTEMTGPSGRPPTEEEIGVLRSMFPNLSREVVVRALQRSNHNTAQAVEALLEESG